MTSRERSPEPLSRGSSGRPRVLVLVGTRPEVIKLAPVVAALEDTDAVDVILALSGQHTTLVDQALRAFELDLHFDLEADYDLELMRPDQDLYQLAGGLLEGVRDVIRASEPDMVVVEGDTATVLFGTLAAFFEGVPVAHVEAGLRSGDVRSPFPEEAFRRMTDVVADVLLAPTPGAADNLRREGAAEASIHVTGNTVVDAVRLAASRQESRGWQGGPQADPRSIEASGRRVVLLTTHRRESFGEPLRRIFDAVRALVESHPDIEIVFPVHPNPAVAGPAREHLADVERVHLVEPLDYLDLVAVLARSALALTDSGGIQEEAPAFGTPVVVLRETTERPEAVETGMAVVVGSDPDRIVAEAERALARTRDTGGGSAGAGTDAPPLNPFGDGRAGDRIADILVHRLTGRPRTTRDWEGPGGGP